VLGSTTTGSWRHHPQVSDTVFVSILNDRVRSSYRIEFSAVTLITTATSIMQNTASELNII